MGTDAPRTAARPVVAPATAGRPVAPASGTGHGIDLSGRSGTRTEDPAGRTTARGQRLTTTPTELIAP
ncbi:hypothetical protein [Micromonospora halophytica]|uniref:Uncharacterized protein n=1 Tax=Micromonospora halophytica TaxID=47864 RepID=A0A1C5I8T0_9ACTN|nr:hypothetical protein [Micromonospora halophytica]SCG54748.1 hypothetical protein GA0070560_10944 [Micromonospora halophytica]